MKLKISIASLLIAVCNLCAADTNTSAIAFSGNPMFNRICGNTLQTLHTETSIAWSCANLLAVMTVPTQDNPVFEMEAEALESEQLPQVLSDAKKDCADINGQFTVTGKKNAPLATCKTDGKNGKFTIQVALEEAGQGTAVKISVKGVM